MKGEFPVGHTVNNITDEQTPQNYKVGFVRHTSALYDCKNLMLRRKNLWFKIPQIPLQTVFKIY